MPTAGTAASHAAQGAPKHPKHPPGRIGIGGWLLATAILAAAYFTAAAEDIPHRVTWAVMLALMSGFFVLVGFSVMRHPFGVLINQRNLVSLSRFQMAAWTLLVLSAYWVMVIKRRSLGIDALIVPIDAEIWMLMGINAAALVGSPFLLKRKEDKVSHDLRAMERTAFLTGETINEIETNRHGNLYGNANPHDASVTDIFQGDEIGNTGYVDLAKLQMFLFTVITLAAYSRAVLSVLNLEFTDYALPKLPEGMVALLGVSNAAYLSSKAVDHTPNGPNWRRPEE